MAWRQLDVPTRVAVVATVLAVPGVVVPPVGVACAIVAATFAAVGVARVRRSHGRPSEASSEQRLVALICLGVSLALIVLLVAGNVFYASTE
jgi:hypothetical protein